MDVSEFDIWWAIERKAREKAVHGRLHVFLDGKSDTQSPQKLLLEAMNAKATYVSVNNGDYAEYYEKIIRQIQNEFMEGE